MRERNVIGKARGKLERKLKQSRLLERKEEMMEDAK
jgi:hypothetical protein